MAGLKLTLGTHVGFAVASSAFQNEQGMTIVDGKPSKVRLIDATVSVMLER